MERLTHPPRLDWRTAVESKGLAYHTTPEGPYWDETAHYRLAGHEVDTLESATYELDRLCLDAVERILSEGRLGDLHIPQEYHAYVAESWERDEHTIDGRFDLAFDGSGPPKMLEYNADTPTGLLEAAVVQWFWLRDCHPGATQFNSLHERLIEAWAAVRASSDAARLHVAALRDNLEDAQTAEYLRDTAVQAGWDTVALDVGEIAYDFGRKLFLDASGAPIELAYKLYPWEALFAEEFGPRLPESPTRWLEAPWKAVLSNKAILALLWEFNPGHPNLLAAGWEPPASGSFARKPVFGREGSGVQLIQKGRLLQQSEERAEGPCVFQELCPLPTFGGKFRPVFGSWMVNGWAAGVGIREDAGYITGNSSRFVPHRVA